MPPKKTFEKKEIIDAALQIIREKGIGELSTRKTAEILNTSTAPIYTYYQSVELLKRDAMLAIADSLMEYAGKEYTRKKSLDCGIGFVLFARDFPVYFKQLFLTGPEYKDIVEDLLNKLKQIFYQDLKSKYPEIKGWEKIAENLWIFSYGLAAQACVGKVERKLNALAIL